MNNILEVGFSGYKLANPFIVGASPSTQSASHILRAAKYGWAGAVTKTLTSSPPYFANPIPFISMYQVNKQIIGMFNNESYTTPTLYEWTSKVIPSLCRKLPSDFFLIGSLMESVDETIWIKSSQSLMRSGVKALELNVSCPHGAPEKYMGTFIGDDPDLLYKIIKSLATSIDLPILVKLSAMSNNIGDLAKACEMAGASGITTTNTLLGIGGININTYLPKHNNENFSTFSGYSGTGIRPLALRAIVDIAKKVTIPIFGVGGINSWEDAVEYILCGASAVQIATAVMINGFKIIGPLLEGVSKYLFEHSETIESLKGKSLSYFVTTDELLRLVHCGYAKINMESCTFCGLCVDVCDDGATGCISLDKLIRIDESQCSGCGLCIGICPVSCLSIKYS